MSNIIYHKLRVQLSKISRVCAWFQLSWRDCNVANYRYCTIGRVTSSRPCSRLLTGNKCTDCLRPSLCSHRKEFIDDELYMRFRINKGSTTVVHRIESAKCMNIRMYFLILTYIWILCRPLFHIFLVPVTYISLIDVYKEKHNEERKEN